MAMIEGMMSRAEVVAAAAPGGVAAKLLEQDRAVKT